MGYKPVVYSHCDFKMPELNWRVSVSVDVFNFEDTTPYKVFWQMEPPTVPGYEGTTAKLLKNWQFYDLILTWDANVLSACTNAKVFPPGAVWWQEGDTSAKKFAVSFLTSSKIGCYEYNLRRDIFNVLPAAIPCHNHGQESTPLPVSKHRSPPYLPNKKDMLVPFQYSIVIENFSHPNYFTEKLNDCFATKTIPIYRGAPNIGDFYNKDAIITWEGTQELMDALHALTPEFYASKQAAIEENYKKALTYYDRTGNVARAIIDSWAPKIEKIHSGEP